MSGGLSRASLPAWLPKSQVFLTFLSPCLGQLQDVLHKCISSTVTLSSTGTGSSVLGIPALLADIQMKSAVSKGDPVTAQQIPLMQDCSGNQTDSSYPQFCAINPSIAPLRTKTCFLLLHTLQVLDDDTAFSLPPARPESSLDSHWIPTHPYHLCFHILVSSEFVNIFLWQYQDTHNCVDSVSLSCFSDISHLGRKCQTSMVSLLFTA